LDCVLACEGRIQAVGDRDRLDRDRLAGCQSLVQRGRGLGLDSDYSGFYRRPDARDESTTTDRDDDDVEVGRILDELQTDGALAGDHERIVEGVNEGTPGLGDQLVETVEGLARVGR